MYTFEPPLTVYGYLYTMATFVVPGWLKNHQLTKYCSLYAATSSQPPTINHYRQSSRWPL